MRIGNGIPWFRKYRLLPVLIPLLAGSIVFFAVQTARLHEARGRVIALPDLTARPQAEMVRDLAEAGYPDAEYMLGKMLAEGTRMPRDPVQAIAWYRRAAAQGYAPAQYALGILFMKGEGTAEDHPQALRYFVQAAEQGFAPAYRQAGYLYQHGIGVEHDNIEAIKWLSLAAEDGDLWAMVQLGQAYREGAGFPQNHSKALELFHRAFDQGYVNAAALIGNAYYLGQGVPADPREAGRWFRIAIEAGSSSAAEHVERIGQNCHSGVREDGFSRFRPDACLLAATASGDPVAMLGAGVSLLHGLGGNSVNVGDGMDWLMKAAHAGNPEAQLYAGNAYARGVWVEQNPVEAYAWYLLALRSGKLHERVKETAEREGALLLSVMDREALFQARLKAAEYTYAAGSEADSNPSPKQAPEQ